jgi:hypothetical protein
MKLILIPFSLCMVLFANAQTANVINTAVPFLRIAPDGRGSAMGDAGVATSPDVHSIFWNTSKLAFIDDEFGIAATYTPWLQEEIDNIFLLDASTYWKLDSLNVVTASFRDFNLGQITFIDLY